MGVVTQIAILECTNYPHLKKTFDGEFINQFLALFHSSTDNFPKPVSSPPGVVYPQVGKRSSRVHFLSSLNNLQFRLLNLKRTKKRPVFFY